MALQRLGPRPVPLAHLLRLVKDSPLDRLLDEPRLRPGRWARNFALATDIREALDERHLDVEERNLASVMTVARRPDQPEPVRALEDEGTAALVDRLEYIWDQRETDAWKHGLLVGLVLGAQVQGTVEGDNVRPLDLIAVVGALLDVAEHLDTEEAMEEGRHEERERQWRESGKSWWDFNGLGGDEEAG